MKLILVRHAEAANLGEGGIATDFDRPLTDTGRAQAATLAAALARLNLKPEVILTSPYLRALQTAEPLASALTPGSPPMPLEVLRLEELKPRKLAKAINDAHLTTSVIVGHMPDLGRLAGWLLGSGSSTVIFDKGAAAFVSCGKTVEKGQGELRWLATPDWFVTSA